MMKSHRTDAYEEAAALERFISPLRIPLILASALSRYSYFLFLCVPDFHPFPLEPGVLTEAPILSTQLKGEVEL